MTKEYALHLLNQLMIGASVDAKPIIPQYELAQALDLAIKALEQQPTGHCKDCRWWKDSDGAYRRGVEAESICPINREEILKGEGYCFLYEPKMQEVEEDES